MGIEPTGDTLHVPPNGFEDRGHHQVCKHFLLPVIYNFVRGISQTGLISLRDRV